MAKEITLGRTKKYKALVDDKDYARLAVFHWWPDKIGNTHYAVRKPYKNGKYVKIYMHREVIGARRGQLVDHINGNGLDNRCVNLRFTNRSKNGRNRINTPPIGITLDKRTGKWVAQITVNYQNIYIGSYARRGDAIKARREAEKRLW